jgi:hypothetical protein
MENKQFKPPIYVALIRTAIYTSVNLWDARPL